MDPHLGAVFGRRHGRAWDCLYFCLFVLPFLFRIQKPEAESEERLKSIFPIPTFDLCLSTSDL